MRKSDLTTYSATMTGRGMVGGVREAFGGSPHGGFVPAWELNGLIDAPHCCAAGSCHEGDGFCSGSVYVTIFGRGRA